MFESFIDSKTSPLRTKHFGMGFNSQHPVISPLVLLIVIRKPLAA